MNGEPHSPCLACVSLARPGFNIEVAVIKFLTHNFGRRGATGKWAFECAATQTHTHEKMNYEKKNNCGNSFIGEVAMRGCNAAKNGVMM